ncbi:hypothetical protein Hanom_Chr11g01061011 [Helianthus anomalus]
MQPTPPSPLTSIKTNVGCEPALTQPVLTRIHFTRFSKSCPFRDEPNLILYTTQPNPTQHILSVLTHHY